MDTVEEREIDWLWYPYIPIGGITALYGPGGAGKSHITVDIASRLSQGEALPGRPASHISVRTLMLSAEDDYGAVLKPRLRLQGANASQIGVPETQFTLDPQGVQKVLWMLEDFRPKLLTIDPIVYYAGGDIDINRSNEVRQLLNALANASVAYQTAVVIVGHTRKSKEGTLADTMMGSADWINGSRSGLLADVTNDGTSILRHAKANWGPKGTSLTYKVDEGFHWLGEVDESFKVTSVGGGKAQSAAVAFLRQVLAAGPVSQDEVKRLALDEQIALATLNRAKSSVAESVYHKADRQWYWHLLPEKQL